MQLSNSVRFPACVQLFGGKFSDCFEKGVSLVINIRDHEGFIRQLNKQGENIRARDGKFVAANFFRGVERSTA
ncbi:MAG: hypothetical protein QY306_10045 [Anaerolineales bacterium]|nr:MAG: hypothetical protein QY306_10045 [Anaerolineales bacterium]